MAKSKEVINPVFPKDFSNIIMDGMAADGADFAPGTVVIRDANNRLVACDGTNAVHQAAPAEIVWTDGVTRFDLKRYQTDGTVLQGYTNVVGSFVADCKISDMFDTADPAVGDFVVKSSSTAGKLEAVSKTELTTLIGTDYGIENGLVLGQVVNDAAAPSGFVRVRFKLV